MNTKFRQNSELFVIKPGGTRSFDILLTVPQPVHVTATYRCDDTRCCIIQFWAPDDEHIVLETCRGVY